jgi:hypothetical protein
MQVDTLPGCCPEAKSCVKPSAQAIRHSAPFACTHHAVHGGLSSANHMQHEDLHGCVLKMYAINNDIVGGITKELAA